MMSATSPPLADAPAPAAPRRAGWLWVALGLWLACVGLLLAIVVVAGTGPVTLEDFAGLLSLFGFASVGALLIARRPEHTLGWLFCLDVLLNGGSSVASLLLRETLDTLPAAIPGATPWFAWVVVWVGDSAWTLLFTLTFLLFPTGRLPSPRWRPLGWMIAFVILFHTLVSMLRPGPFDYYPELSNPVGVPLPSWALAIDDFLNETLIVVVVLCVASVFVRYRAGRGEERQQIKWIAFVAAAMIFTFVLGEITRSLSLPGEEVVAVAANSIYALFPVAVGISILRHRLFDIDLIIRRTLIYALLTGVLALIYFGSVVLFEGVLRGVVGGGSQVAIVLSTLVIAALFGPLRERVQRAIDRRFFRRKYDAARTLAAFGARTRDETDLNQLRERLAGVVHETMQPQSVELWLRPDNAVGESPPTGRPREP